MPLKDPVIIIGAGVVGLAFAHGLKKAGIPFEIYERDEAIDSRGQGWAITVHWALPFLQNILSPDVYAALDSVQVDPAIGRNDEGNFLFINLANLEPKFRIPPNQRKRVNREKLRRLLLNGVAENVHWSKRLLSIESDDEEVTCRFQDGSTATGSLLVGAEGSNSKTRQHLKPESYRNYELPVRFVGVAMDMNHEQVKPLKDLDPLLFQGSHPDTGVFLWVSILDVPETNGTLGGGDERYRIQINLSWLVESDEDQVPLGDSARLAQMKEKADGFAPTLKTVVDSIPEGTEVIEIKLMDWPCEQWDNQGMITLLGDAAHAMTMYRGEAANHGMLDAYNLVSKFEAAQRGDLSVKQALDEYEGELRERTTTAVLLSRQACLDAHDFNGLNENSAVLRRRAIAAK